MKRILYYISVFSFIPFVLFGVFWSKAWATSCAIQSGPISEMTDYSSRINKELSIIAEKARAKNLTCEKNTFIKVSSIFDGAYADLIALQYTHIDFLYNTKVAFQGKAHTPVRRDEKFFDILEKSIERTVEQLSSSCSIDSEIALHLQTLIKEVQTMKMAYQKSALGQPLISSQVIRPENMKVVEAMNVAYHPSAISLCDNQNESEKDFLKTLKSIFNIGGKMEDALSTWRKALALFRGGGK